MSLSGNWNLYIRSQRKQTGPLCDLRKEVDFNCPQVLAEGKSDLDLCFYEQDLPSDRTFPLSFVEDKSYSGPFHLCANESLLSWFLLLANSSICLSKNLKFFYGFRLVPAQEVFFPQRTIPKADNTSQKILKYKKAALCAKSSSVNDIYIIDSPLNCSGNSGVSYRCSFENPSTPLGTKSDSSSEISDLDRASYWDSLLNLEREDCEWISNFKPCGCLSGNPSTPLGTRCDSSSEVSDLDKASFWDSLLTLEGEDSQWISDLKPYGWSSKNPSTPLSTNCDASSEVSDLDRATYLDSLLLLKSENYEWISDSNPELEYFRDGFPGPSCKSSWCSEVRSSAEDHLETAGMEQVIADEPLFWPFEEEFNWNSEDSWSSFCISPRKQINCFSMPEKSFGSKLLESKLELKKGCRRRLAFGSTSTASRMEERKQKGDEAECSSKYEPSMSSMLSKSSAKIAPLDSREDKGELKTKVVPSIKQLSAGKNSQKKDPVSNKGLPMGRGDLALDLIETLVGLKEFDGHEGLDTEFNWNVFMQDESL